MFNFVNSVPAVPEHRSSAKIVMVVSNKVSNKVNRERSVEDAMVYHSKLRQVRGPPLGRWRDHDEVPTTPEEPEQDEEPQEKEDPEELPEEEEVVVNPGPLLERHLESEERWLREVKGSGAEVSAAVEALTLTTEEPVVSSGDAATTIAAIVRGALRRWRYVKCMAVLRERRDAVLAAFGDELAQHQNWTLKLGRFEKQVHDARQIERELKLIQRSFNGWARAAKFQRKTMAGPRAEALDRQRLLSNRLVREVISRWRRSFHPLVAGTDDKGRRSTVEATERAKTRLATRYGVNPETASFAPSDVRAEVVRQAAKDVRDHRCYWSKRIVFAALKRICVDGVHNQDLLARTHWKRTVLRKVFPPWSFLQDEYRPKPTRGLPEGIRYNRRLVERFLAKRQRGGLTAPAFRNWKRFWTVAVRSRIVAATTIVRTKRAVLQRWQHLRNERCRTRREALEQWEKAGRRLISRPFHAWRDHTKTSKAITKHREKYIARRLASRSKIFAASLLRLWRDLAIYGKAHGFFSSSCSRADLAKALTDARAHASRLEARVHSSAAQCRLLAETVDKGLEQNRKLRNALSNAEDKAENFKTTIDACKRQFQQTQAVVESLARIHPDRVRKGLRSILVGTDDDMFGDFRGSRLLSSAEEDNPRRDSIQSSKEVIEEEEVPGLFFKLPKESHESSLIRELQQEADDKKTAEEEAKKKDPPKKLDDLPFSPDSFLHDLVK